MKKRHLLAAFVAVAAIGTSDVSGQTERGMSLMYTPKVRTAIHLDPETRVEAKKAALSSRLTGLAYTEHNGAYYEPQDSIALFYSNDRGGQLDSPNAKFDRAEIWEYQPGTDSYIKAGIVTQTFDISNNILSQTMVRWDAPSSSFVNYIRHLNTYDVRNNLLTQTAQEWNTSNNNWSNESQYIYTYNGNNMQLTEISQDWVPASNSWKNDEKYTHTYDANNNMLTYLYQTWDAVTNTWDNEEMYIYTYFNGLLTSNIQQYWSNLSSAWINDTKYSHTYENGDEIESLEQSWRVGSSSWENENRRLYSYDVNSGVGPKNLITTIYQLWIFSSWRNSTRYEYSYNATNDRLTELRQTWAGFPSSWRNSYLHTSTYDNSHNQLTHLEQAWSSADTLFVNSTFLEKSYNNYNQLLTETSNTWNAGGFWQPTTDDYQNRYYYEEYGTTAIAALSKTDNVTIYPSPATSQINIDLKWSEPQPAFISIYDVTGRLWNQWNVSASNNYHNTLNVSNFPAGNYYIKINGSKVQTVKTFAVVH